MMRFVAIYLVALFLPPLVLLLGARQEREAEFRFAVGAELNTLDPQRMSWLHDIRIAECIFEPLVRFRLPEMTVEAAAARSWQVSDDGLTYTFELRPEARWSNGDPVRASDFVYAWRRALLPDLAADYTQLLFNIRGAEVFFAFRAAQLKDYAREGTQRSAEAAARLWEQAADAFDRDVGVRATDETTLTVTLERPTPHFIELCAFVTFMPVHASSVERFVDLNAESGMLKIDSRWIKPGNLVSNGPYRLASWRFKRDLLLLACEHYWNRQALGIGSIQQRVIEAPVTQWLAYQSGQVDWLPGVPTTKPLAADLVEQGRPDVHVVPGAGTYFYNFNCRERLADGTANPLADRRLRLALSMAIDRKTLVDRVTRLSQPVARTFVPVGTLPAYDPPVEAGVGFDPIRAAALLEEARFTEGEHDLRGLSIMYNTGHGHESIAQAIKSMWKKHLGIEVALEGVEGRRFGERLKSQDYTVARAGWFGDYRDPTTFLDKFLTGNGNNDAAWSEPAFDKLMRQAAGQNDPRERMNLLRRAEVLMLEAQPVAPLFQYVTVHVYDPGSVSRLHPNAWHMRRLELVEVDRKK
jgi:oligopeptide transport system substrate-binding protein